MATDDDDEIAVYIVPKIDEDAAEAAKSSLQEKFKDVADIGGGLFDALADSGVVDGLREQLSSALADPLKDVAESFGVDLEEPLKKVLTKDFSGALDDVVEQAGTKLGSVLSDPLKDLADTVGIDLEEPLKKVVSQDFSGALDDVIQQAGTKLGSVLADPLKGVGDALGVDIGNAVEKALKGDTSGAIDQVAKELGTKAGSALSDGIREVTGLELDLSHLGEQVKPLADVLRSLRSGDAGGVIGGVNDLTGGTLQPGVDMHQQVKQTVSDTKELAEGFLAGRAGGEAVAGAATEAAAPVAASLALVGPVENFLKDLPGVGGFFKDSLPDEDSAIMSPFRHIGGMIMHPSRMWDPHSGSFDKNGNFVPFGEHAAAPHDTGAAPPHDTQDPSVFAQQLQMAGIPVPQGLPTVPRDTTDPHPSGGSQSAGTIDVEAQSAVVSAGTVTIAGGIALPPGMSAAAQTQQYIPGTGAGATEKPAKGSAAEAHLNRPSLPSIDDLIAPQDSGGTSIGKGGYSHGGVLPGDSPGHDNLIGMLPSGHAVGLEGGEGVIKPGAMDQPGVSDIVANLNHHYSGGGGPIGAGGAPAPAPSTTIGGPAGAGGRGAHDLPGAPHSEKPVPGKGTVKEGDPKEPEGQEKPGQVDDPHGTGKGFGVGGGLIGMAEGAASSAANSFAPGSGAAVSMASQEVNKAIGFAGQLGSILAFEMPLDEFSVDPSGPGNVMNSWYGKLGLSLVGGHDDVKNTAGKTQSPLTSPEQTEHAPGPAGGAQGGSGVTVNIGSQTNHAPADHASFSRAMAGMNPSNPQNYAYDTGHR